MRRSRWHLLVKWRTAALLWLALLAVSFTPALAQAQPDALAPSPIDAYVPADTLIYAAADISDTTIAGLDAVIAQALGSISASPLGEQLPPITGNVTLTALLDLLAQQAADGSFADVFRPWLGNRGAYALFGIITEQWLRSDLNTIPQALFVTINDPTAAASYLDGVLQPGYSQTAQGEFTIYAQDDTVLLLTREVLILTNPAGAELLLAGVEDTLTQDERFTETVALLPAPPYAGLIYLNTADLVALSLLGLQAPEAQAEQMLASAGQQAIAFTMLDARTLAMDAVQQVGELPAGMPAPALTPVDPDFLRFVPADAGLVIHSTNLRGTYEQATASLIVQAQLQGLDIGEVEAGIAQFEDALAQLFGLDFDTEIIGWMDGDYTLFASYAVPEPGELSFVTSPFYYDQVADIDFEFGLLVEATDPELAAQFAVAAGETAGILAEFAPESGIVVSSEDAAGSSMTVISLPVGNPFSTEDVTYPPLSEPLELVIGATDEVFFISTRGAAEDLLDGAAGFDRTPQYAEAAQYMLPDAAQVLVMDATGFALLGDTFGLLVAPAVGSSTSIEPSPCEEAPDSEACAAYLDQQKRDTLQWLTAGLEAFTNWQVGVRGVSSVFSSASASAAFTEDGGSIARYVLTLAGE